ncbi:hypothetical protein, partial [Tenacibaculum sp. 1_MG-2023]|uniref:hypothetical protein n=1 Tax=Tenacibaculum sp. 1_MG-2023 TaxID=3062653 RepID=UPI0026E2C031
MMLLFSWNINSQNNGSPTCDGANPMCSDNNGVKIFPNVTGSSGTPGNPTPAYGCLNDSPNAAWFYIKVGQAGDLNFQIVQNTVFDSNGNPIGNALDVDFVAWGPFNTPNNNCNSLAETCITGICPDNTSNPGYYLNNLDGTNIIDCSWSAQTEESFTITNTQQGEFYILLVTNWTPAGTDGTGGFIKLEQTNFGVAGAGVTDCSIIAGDLGPDQTVCERTPPTPITLNGTPTTGIAIDYTWSVDTGSGFNVITAAQGNPTLTIDNNVSGTYQVEVFDGTNSSIDDVVITFLPPPTATQLANIEICDTDGAGHTFDLTTNDATIIGSQTGVEVKYYTSFADAEADTGNITNFNFTVNALQQFWARAYNTDTEADLNCDTITDFEVTYAIEPTPATATDIIVCDDAVSGSSTDGIFTFSQFIDKDAEILGTLSATDYSVSYHTTQSGAQTDATTDVIDKNTTFTNTTSYNQEIFVRVENTLNTMCTVDQSFFLRVLDLPVANPVSTIEKCDASGGTTATFNFETEVTPDVLLTQSTTDFEVLYFETSQAAIDNVTGTNITGNYTNTAANQTIYVRIHNVSNPDLCPQFTNFQITVFSTPILNTTFEDTTHCENDTFNITIDSTADTFIWQVSTDNGINWNDVVADVNYSNETTTSLQIDDVPQTFNNNQYRVRMNRTGNTCQSISNSITLTINPIPTPIDITILQCDDDADLISIVNLTLEQPNISTNHTSETFQYYLTQAQAVAGGTPTIPDPVIHNATNGVPVYVRTLSAQNCPSVSEIAIVISFAADVPYNRNFIQCDDFLDFDGNDTPGSNDDTDGISTFDFSAATSEILADPSLAGALNLDVKYFETIADRASEINEIPDISNHRNNNDSSYANLQTIYAKIINTVNNDCTGLAELTLQTTPVPVANTINPDNEYELCDDFVDGDGSNGVIQSFDLESQTAAILGSQDPLAYTVTYHESTADATSGANPLASPYTNITPNRQTIYVRVSGNGCYYDRYSFDILVNSLPIANQLNMANTHEVCDNDDDGSATNGFVQNIDLETLTTTILGTQDPTNFTVTYHTSYALAQTGAIPITGMYSNATQGGDTVYVRIVNNTTTCVNDTFNFQVQVNAEPLANPDNLVSNLSECDNDADGDDANGFVQSFDLESQIPDILGDPTVQDEDDFNVTFHLTQA